MEKNLLVYKICQYIADFILMIYSCGRQDACKTKVLLLKFVPHKVLEYAVIVN
jgi:hypothetical protein